MAGIQIRHRNDGTPVYRVRFRREGFKPFHICFMKREEAEKWVEDHEERYYENPDSYQNWAKSMFNMYRKVENRKDYMKKIKVK